MKKEKIDRWKKKHYIRYVGQLLSVGRWRLAVLATGSADKRIILSITIYYTATIKFPTFILSRCRRKERIILLVLMDLHPRSLEKQLTLKLS